MACNPSRGGLALSFRPQRPKRTRTGRRRLRPREKVDAVNTIAVELLRVGMYIQLEGGWLSHPFPLSAFRITTAQEIATLHGLGLRQVRWVPEKSELPDEAGQAAPIAAAGAPPPVQRVPDPHQAWLLAQRTAARHCERQYTEAAQAWREACAAAADRPEHAGRQSEALARAMIDKMLAADEVGIRLVSGAGDRVAAHALNVAVVAMLIGRTMGLDEADLQDLGVGALMHDIGKAELPDRLRQLEEGATTAETNAYREHVDKGVAQGRRMALAAGALAVIAQHHEHADGSGFPLRMSADRMTLSARIVAIVNRYDKLCNPATRALALTPHEAVAMLFAQGRSRFDPPVLNAFIRMMGVYPAGSLVQLTDDRYALVVGVNGTRPLKPRVLVHGPAPAAQMLDLEQLPDLGIRRSLPPNRLPPAVLASLDPRPRVAYYFEPLQGVAAGTAAEMAA